MGLWLTACATAVAMMTTATAAQQAPVPALSESRGKPAIRSAAAATLETTRPVLADLARKQATNPNVENERQLAFEYVSQGILDAAFDHFQAALRLDPRDASSHEGIARIWRDWGFPDLGLPSAYRAVYWMPDSASAQNTLGTLFLKLDLTAAAAIRFERARMLDPTAAYPLNNLCYVSLRGGRADEAVEWCRAATSADATSEQVRNNFALALARSGDLDGAVEVLAASPQAAAAAYNQGLLLIASQQPDRAREALMRARTSDPAFAPALKLLRQLATHRAGL
jgi:Tfp pilus assembly protein PilF